MTLDRASELLAVQINMGGGYNRNAAKLILAEVERAWAGSSCATHSY